MKAKKVYIIAEAGVNHNGSLERALKMVDVASESKADAIKFQTFRTEDLVSKEAPKAEYQTRNDGNSDSQFEMLKKLELSESDHFEIIEYCKKKKIDFLSTPFDLRSLKFLIEKLHLDTIKIPSGEITNGPFLLEISKVAKKVILSTGMSNLSEIESALSILAFGFVAPNDDKPTLEKFRIAFQSKAGKNSLYDRVTILHATTEYPAPVSEVNLSAMQSISAAFKIPVGYSDHTLGIHIPVAAVSMGASIIEKHFTLDKTLPGPDHKASLEPDELTNMVKCIRDIEEALGDGRKVPVESEIKNIPIARKSLHAALAIRAGEVFSKENITFKRPGNGISPMLYWELLGKKSNFDFHAGDPLQ